MAGLDPTIVDTIENAIDHKVRSASSKSAGPTTGTVTKIDGNGVVWVSAPGMSNAVPIQNFGEAVNVGDEIGFSIAGGYASLLANRTALEKVREAAGNNESFVRQLLTEAEKTDKIVGEIERMSKATNQHFWAKSDNTETYGYGAGAFITDRTQEEWLDGASRDFDDISDENPYSNFLLTSEGALIRRGGTPLASFSRSAVSFLDGLGTGPGNIVARFGTDGAQIGRAGESRQVLDYHGIRMVDKEGDDYFRVSDLRDRSGEASVIDNFIGDGATESFALSLQAIGTQYEVSVSDSSGGNVSKTTDSVTFSAAPTNGAEITVSYVTGSADAKAYTLGRRGSGNIGGMSLVSGRNCVSSGYCSHAEGYKTTASGNYSHAEGSETTASSDNSHAEGWETTASGRKGSHAEGRKTTASGNYSHAEGYKTTASGRTGSHAEGRETTASGDYSHAEGYKTTASGHYSHAQNRATVAESMYQTAMGRYNKADTESKYSLIIGNGTDENNRSNALTVDWDGNVAMGKTGTGYFLTDRNGMMYPGVYDNGSSLWLGATKGADYHHHGRTILSTGYNPDASTGWDTIQVAVPNASNNGASFYDVWHKGTLPQTAWTKLPLSSDCVAYNDGDTPYYRKTGGMVHVVGGVKPKASIAAEGSMTIGTLPAGFRPRQRTVFICQGSGTAIWALTVNTNGTLVMSRYRNGTSYIALGTSTWLIFNVTFAHA